MEINISNGFSKGLLILILSVLVVFDVVGAPIPPIPRTLVQSDQTAFEAILWGDEYSYGVEASNGFSISFSAATDDWMYATLDQDGYLVPSATIYDPSNENPTYQDGTLIPKHLRPTGEAENMQSHEDAYYAPDGSVLLRDVPSIGTGQIAFIPINYNDTSTAISSSSLNDLFFSSSANSLKSYFEEVSYGNFTINGAVTAWVSAGNDHDYYETKDDELAREAIIAIDPTFNFSYYDQNGDCYVDAIGVIHQGGDQGTNDIRSQRSSLDKKAGGVGAGSYITNDVCFADPGKNMIANDYIVVPELFGKGDEVVITSIGVYAHEYGHMLGLPDLYDLSRTGTTAGIGLWGLMGWGMWNGSTNYLYGLGNADTPAHMCAWSKYHLGWVTPQLLTGVIDTYSIEASSDAADVLQILEGSPTPTPTGEYYLIENRQLRGFDSALPSSGLAIWHIDESKSETNNNVSCYPPSDCTTNHYRVSLVQADGNWDLEHAINYDNLGDSGDLYKSSLYGLSDATVPSSNLFDGTESGVVVEGIGTSSLYMDVNLGLSPGSAQFSTGNYSAYEDVGSIPVTVTRIGGSAGAVSVECNLSSGTATQGNDYSGTTQVLSWADGETSSKTCWVTALDDNYIEGDETIQLSLSNTAGGVVIGSPSVATLTIQDNESCTGDVVVIDSVAFQAGTTTICTGTTSITATNTNVENSANVTFVSPTIKLKEGFTGNPTFTASQ